MSDLAMQGAVDINDYNNKLIRAEVVTVGKDGLGQDLSKNNR